MRNQIFIMLGLLLAVCLIIIGVTSKDQLVEPKRSTISIASQYGLAYAPLQIMERTSVLKDALPPGTLIVWKNLSNTAAIREAMLADEVDIGFMAIPPFLIGRQNGMQWKIASALCESPTGLVSSKNSIRSINDITEKDQIALPQPGSIQHILLSMASNKAFGDPAKFDDQLISLSHPDGYAAMLAKGDISLHFTTLPYLAQELAEPSFHQILSGENILGEPFSFIVGACPEKFHDGSPELYEGFLKALDETILWMENHPDETASMLAPIYGLEEDEIKYQLPQMRFDRTVRGLGPISDFMVESGLIDLPEQNQDALYFEGTLYE